MSLAGRGGSTVGGCTGPPRVRMLPVCCTYFVRLLLFCSGNEENTVKTPTMSLFPLELFALGLLAHLSMNLSSRMQPTSSSAELRCVFTCTYVRTSILCDRGLCYVHTNGVHKRFLRAIELSCSIDLQLQGVSTTKVFLSYVRTCKQFCN